MAKEQEVKDVLNTIVASQGLMYIKLHQLHWYVKGPHFFALHEKFEELYDQMTEDLDEVAERLLAIGGEPYSTLEEYMQHSVIKESSDYKTMSEKEMVQEAVKDYRRLGEELEKGIRLTEEAEDDPSNDMLIAIKNESEKQVWMLQAFLGNEATEEV